MTLTQILQKIKSVFYTKSEVDASLSGYLPKSGGAMTGTLTLNGKAVDTIEEQGDGYIRYSNGIQVCWGTFVTTTQLMSITFGKAFLSITSYSVAVCSSFSTNCWITGDRATTGVTLATELGDGVHRRMDWQAIGKWK